MTWSKCNTALWTLNKGPNNEGYRSMQKIYICMGNSKTKCIKVPFNFKMFFFSFFYLHLQLALPLHGALYKIKIMCKITGNKSHSAGVLRTMQHFLFF